MVAINGLQTVSVYLSIMSALSGGIPAAQNKSLGSPVTWIYYSREFTTDSMLAAVASQPRRLLFISKAVGGTFDLFCLSLVWHSRRIGHT
jgi:hypothetical protein